MRKRVDGSQIDRKERAYFYDCSQWRPRQIEWYHPNRFQTEHFLHYISPIFDYSQRSHSSSSCLAVRTRRIHSWPTGCWWATSTYLAAFIPELCMLTRENFTVKNGIVCKSFQSSDRSTNFDWFIQWNATFLERMRVRSTLKYTTGIRHRGRRGKAKRLMRRRWRKAAIGIRRGIQWWRWRGGRWGSIFDHG